MEINIKFEVIYIINLKTCFRALLKAFIQGIGVFRRSDEFFY